MTSTEEKLAPPPGEWGVFAEPAVGQNRDPQWAGFRFSDYESAAKHADYMNRKNYAWFYYAKPVMRVKPLTDTSPTIWERLNTSLLEEDSP